MYSLMRKLKNIRNPLDLSEAEIEFLTGKNSIHDSQLFGNKISINLNIEQQNINVSEQKNVSEIQHSFFSSMKCGKFPPKKPQEPVMNGEQIICSNCKSVDTMIKDHFGGMVVCKNCGQVLESFVLDHNPEWKNYEDGQCCSSRCGLPTNALLPQSSLGTTIGGNCNYRLKTLHNWGLMPYKERSLNTVLNTIKAKCALAGLLGCIEDDAKILYKIASECKNLSMKNNIIIRGKNRTGLMAACIFYACKRRGHTKSLKEVAKLFGMKSSCVNKGCKNFIRYVKYKNIDYNTNLSHPSQYIQQFCEKLNIDKKATKKLMEMSVNVQKTNIVPSHTPISIAAACILLYATEHSIKRIDKHLISTTFSISEVTLTKAYSKMYKFRDILTNNKTVDKLIVKSKNNNLNLVTPENLIERMENIKKINVALFTSVVEIKIFKYMSTNLSEHVLNVCNMCITYNNECNKKMERIREQYMNM
jgi:transcription initiation factor TFIIB